MKNIETAKKPTAEKFHYVINYVCEDTGDMIAIADTINGNENLMAHIKKWQQAAKRYNQDINAIQQCKTATEAAQLAEYWNAGYKEQGKLNKWYLRELIA